MNSKDRDTLTVNRTQQKFAKSHQRVRSSILSLAVSFLTIFFIQVPHTYREDQSLKFGDGVMLKNSLTNGWLVCDMSDRITSNDEAYAVTTTEKAVGACARSVIHIVRASQNQGGPASDDLVRYG